MTLPSVLVIGSRKNTGLRDALFDAGLTPVLRQTILGGITALRKEQFLAVVVDCDNTTLDVLEVILNVRDLDENLRLFVLSENKVDLAGLQSRRLVWVVDRDRLMHKLSPVLVRVTGE